MMTLVEEPATRRLFVSDMRGLLYAVSPDGKTVTPYLDLRDPKWGVAVQSQGRERGVQSFTLHPQFAQAGTPGFGKFYTYTDTSNQTPAPDFTTPGEKPTHDTVLLEWTAKTPGAATYDGEAPRELIRLRQPFANHNGGAIAFNPTARPGTADFGLLYVGIADGGSGGDPMKLAQNLGSAFGKILRIDPLGKNGRGGKYGIPAANPFVSTADALPEIFAYGIRNAQRFGWDPQERRDVHVRHRPEHRRGSEPGHRRRQSRLEHLGGQLPLRQPAGGEHRIAAQRSEGHLSDRRMGPARSGPAADQSSASVGVVVYRSTTVPQLTGRLLFGDMPSGELFHVSADKLPKGGQDPDPPRALRDRAGRGAAHVPPDHSGEEQGAGQDARDARGPAIRRERGRADLPAEQGRRDDSSDREVTVHAARSRQPSLRHN